MASVFGLLIFSAALSLQDASPWAWMRALPACAILSESSPWPLAWPYVLTWLRPWRPAWLPASSGLEPALPEPARPHLSPYLSPPLASSPARQQEAPPLLLSAHGRASVAEEVVAAVAQTA